MTVRLILFICLPSAIFTSTYTKFTPAFLLCSRARRDARPGAQLRMLLTEWVIAMPTRRQTAQLVVPRTRTRPSKPWLLIVSSFSRF